jgi:hypothetical protein
MSYRDDHDALRGYHDDLARQLASLEARAVELETVEAERARIAQELIRVRRDLAHQTSRRNPIRLDNLRVASPCKESWDKMTGDDRVRDCARCEKPVFDLSTLTVAQAEDLLATRGVTMCVRFFRRADGKVMTADCPVGQRGQRRKLALAAGVLAGAAGAAGAAVALSGDDEVAGTFVGEISHRQPLDEVKGEVVDVTTIELARDSQIMGLVVPLQDGEAFKELVPPDELVGEIELDP